MAFRLIRFGLGALILLALTDANAEDPATQRHLIYLHGRIVQTQQSRRPQNPEFGYYELDQILDVFRARHFEVSSELRPKEATVTASADKLKHQIHKLLEDGVPPDHITVVGASMGAAITLLASARLQNPNVRFCVLGACLSKSVPAILADEGKAPSGHLLAIREASDDIEGSCGGWEESGQKAPGLVARELVLHTGLKHGFLYRPLPEWVGPVAEFAAAP